MSQENVEVVRAMAETWNEAGWGGVADRGLLHPDVEYNDDPKWPEARSAVGPAAIVERFTEVMEILGKDAKVEVEELVDAGEGLVVMVFRFTGEARASGLQHDYRWGFVCRVENRQIAYLQAYLDPEQALAVAGRSG
jgi:ketosteroid isomerase-like protein